MDLTDAGWRVTLAERRPFAGGRAFSFTTDNGDVLDNGQHVFLGCCTAYIGLLRRLGRLDKAFLQQRLEVHILDAESGSARLREAPLPAPGHLLPSLLGFPSLSAAEKLSAVRALLEIRRRDLPEDQAFAAWLTEHGQTPNAIQRLWNLIVVPTCNAPAERVSAAIGGFVFREGLLRTRWGGRIGYPRVGLSEIVPDRSIAYLRQHGAEVRLGSAVQKVDPSAAHAVIVAVPSYELPNLMPEAWARQAGGLEWAPIVGINLWYDRPVFDGEVLAVNVHGQALWLFDRTRILGKSGSEHHVAVSISAAERVMDVPRSELAGQIAADLARALPAARRAQLLRSHVEKVRQATFVPSPDSAACRLGPRTPWPNVFLAGAWTATGWPDTMEGAIRSGHTAASLAQNLVQKALD